LYKGAATYSPSQKLVAYLFVNKLESTKPNQTKSNQTKPTQNSLNFNRN